MGDKSPKNKEKRKPKKGLAVPEPRVLGSGSIRRPARDASREAAMFGINVIVVVETFIAFILAVVIHEAAHAATAALLGDTTLAARRRLSLNPRRQLSAIGVIVAIAQSFNLYAGLGWGKTLEVDARRLRVGPNLGTILVALAGPVVNAIIGIGVALRPDDHPWLQHIGQCNCVVRRRGAVATGWHAVAELHEQLDDPIGGGATAGAVRADLRGDQHPAGDPQPDPAASARRLSISSPCCQTRRRFPTAMPRPTWS